MKIGDIIKLTWKTKRYGKARICQHGEMWKVKDIQDTILCKGIERGPWLLIESTGESWDMRWIHQTDDQNFSIVD